MAATLGWQQNSSRLRPVSDRLFFTQKTAVKVHSFSLFIWKHVKTKTKKGVGKVTV